MENNKRVLTKAQKVMQSITTAYSHTLLTPFFKAITEYRLIEPDDKIAVCLSGGKDSALLAMLMKHLSRLRDDIEVKYICMDPGYTRENRQKLEENCAMLEIPIHIFETNVLEQSEKQSEKSPCFVCAQKRRGWLYKTAQNLDCNKIALGHNFDDVIETTVMGMFFGGQIQGMLPMVKSNHFEGMRLIRPICTVRESDIVSWASANELRFLRCACKFSQGENASKRAYVKQLIAQTERDVPNIKQNIFHALSTADCDTLIGYKANGKRHSFLERFDK